jgi:NitT/TauT family transport system permease protein
VIGYVLCVALGALFGALLARFELLRQTLGALFLGIQTLPSICWLPLAILWFGLNENAIMFVIVMGSFFSSAISISSAIRLVPNIYIQAARNMGERGLSLYYKVILPAAMPQILEGLRQSWSFAWRSLMAGELIFTVTGLGHLLNMGRELNDINRIIAVMIVIVFLGILSEKLIFYPAAANLAKKWGFTAK